MKKSISQTLLEDLESIVLEPLSSESIATAFEKKLAQFGLDKVLQVMGAEVGEDGDVSVELMDKDDNTYVLVFIYDEKEGPQGFVLSDKDEAKKSKKKKAKKEENDDEDVELAFDLAPLNPSVVKTAFGDYMNMSDLSWLDQDTLMGMLMAAGCPIGIAILPKAKQDEFGQFLRNESMDEAFRIIIKGGRKVRVPLVRRLRKKRLTPRQRMGLRKAAMKRKLHSAQAMRKRRKSLALRKRLHLKPGKVPRGFKLRR